MHLFYVSLKRIVLLIKTQLEMPYTQVSWHIYSPLFFFFFLAPFEVRCFHRTQICLGNFFRLWSNANDIDNEGTFFLHKTSQTFTKSNKQHQTTFWYTNILNKQKQISFQNWFSCHFFTLHHTHLHQHSFTFNTCMGMVLTILFSIYFV